MIAEADKEILLRAFDDNGSIDAMRFMALATTLELDTVFSAFEIQQLIAELTNRAQARYYRKVAVV